MSKTIAARILDNLGITYTLLTYPVDQNDLNAVEIASRLGFPAPMIFKTLVLKGDRTGVVIACLPSDRELDLKALAKISGNKNVELIPAREVPHVSGYVRGGVSPLGMKKSFPVFLHSSAMTLELIGVSGGKKGSHLLLRGEDLVKATSAFVSNFTYN